MSTGPNMHHQHILESELGKFVTVGKTKKYLRSWNKIRAKRFAGQFLIIFICQYIAITQVAFSLPSAAMYPPMGVAFVMLYLFGGSSIIALLCVGFCAYFLKGFTAEFIIFYLIADVGACSVGVLLCQNSFSSDNPWADNLGEWLGFIAVNLGITSLISSITRMIPIYLNNYTHMTNTTLFYNFIDLWLADLNAILVLFGFSITWLYLSYSRGSVTPNGKIKKIPLLSALFFIILSALFMQRYAFNYLIAISMLLSLYLSCKYRIIIATALLYFTSFLYLAHFTINKYQFLQNYGIEYYTLIPMILFIYSAGMLCCSSFGTRAIKNSV